MPEELRKHLEEDYLVGSYDFVIEALGYAETVLQGNRSRMRLEDVQDLSESLDQVINQVVNEQLTVDSQKIIEALIAIFIATH